MYRFLDPDTYELKEGEGVVRLPYGPPLQYTPKDTYQEWLDRARMKLEAAEKLWREERDGIPENS